LKRKINEEKTKRKYYYLTFLMMFALIPLYLYISIFPFGKKTIEEVKQLSNEELINYVDKTRIFNDEVDKIVYSFNYCKVDEDCEAFI
jgi:Na+-translocating ferredoxin:NAD+ oxidoreductase RnfG subunit